MTVIFLDSRCWQELLRVSYFIQIESGKSCLLSHPHIPGELLCEASVKVGFTEPLKFSEEEVFQSCLVVWGANTVKPKSSLCVSNRRNVTACLKG